VRAAKPRLYNFSSQHCVAVKTSAGDRPLIQAFVEELKRG
jgi:hypothetical protein